MAYILVEKFRNPDGTIVDNGYYGGEHPKYSDVFNYTPDKEAAYRFDDKEQATKRAESLNRADYAFIVEYVD
jgi:hypothetical protein